MAEAKRLVTGAIEFGGGVKDVVRELTGAPATPFEATAKRYAALHFAQRTPANLLCAIWHFSRTPLEFGRCEHRSNQERHPFVMTCEGDAA